MKEYIKNRLEELRKEKEIWLSKLEFNENEETARLQYLITIAKMNELLELELKVND